MHFVSCPYQRLKIFKYSIQVGFWSQLTALPLLLKCFPNFYVFCLLQLNCSIGTGFISLPATPNTRSSILCLNLTLPFSIGSWSTLSGSDLKATLSTLSLRTLDISCRSVKGKPSLKKMTFVISGLPPPLRWQMSSFFSFFFNDGFPKPKILRLVLPINFFRRIEW